MPDRVLRLLVDLQVDRCAEECLNTLPIPWKQNQEAYQLRYVFGYAMDGSDLPCYILWPARTAEQSFWCIDAWKGDWVRLDKCAYMAPLGIEHFFDAFCFDPQKALAGTCMPSSGHPVLPCFRRHTSGKSTMRTGSRLRQGASQLKGGHLLQRVKSIKTWLEEKRGCLMQYLMLRVVGQGCRTIPPRTQSVLIWKPHRLTLTRIDLTQPMMRFVTWPMAYTTLTSDGTPGVSPVKMRLVFH